MEYRAAVGKQISCKCLTWVSGESILQDILISTTNSVVTCLATQEQIKSRSRTREYHYIECLKAKIQVSSCLKGSKLFLNIDASGFFSPTFV